MIMKRELHSLSEVVEALNGGKVVEIESSIGTVVDSVCQDKRYVARLNMEECYDGKIHPCYRMCNARWIIVEETFNKNNKFYALV